MRRRAHPVGDEEEGRLREVGVFVHAAAKTRVRRRTDADDDRRLDQPRTGAGFGVVAGVPVSQTRSRNPAATNPACCSATGQVLVQRLS